MNSHTTSKAAGSKRADSDRTGFRGREVMPPDRLSTEDYQRALHDECDFGAQPLGRYDQKTFPVDHDFDHHLF
ncbi:MAG: hypothetical protein U0R44_00640 [Candidatus Micrarchaeia archaeon]